LNTKINRKNQKIGKIIDILRKEEKRTKIIIESVKNGRVGKFKRDDKRIKNIVNNFSLYEKDEFITILSDYIRLYTLNK